MSQCLGSNSFRFIVFFGKVKAHHFFFSQEKGVKVERGQRTNVYFNKGIISTPKNDDRL